MVINCKNMHDPMKHDAFNVHCNPASPFYEGNSTRSMFSDDFDIKNYKTQNEDNSNLIFTYSKLTTRKHRTKLKLNVANLSQELPSKAVLLNIILTLGMFLLYKTIFYMPFCVMFIITTVYNIYRYSKPSRTQKHKQLELPLWTTK